MRVSSHGRIAVAIALLLLTAGCAEVLTGDGPITFEAEPASVSDSAVNEAGYELEASEPVVINRTVEFEGQERRLEITNHAAVYGKSVQRVDAAFFVAFSTPEAEMFGQALNPLGSLDKERLLERVASQRTEVRDVERTGSFELEILGDTRTVDTFTAVTDVEGRETNVTLHVARFTHEDDIIVAVGGYPTEFDDREGVTAMLQGIEHPVE